MFFSLNNLFIALKDLGFTDIDDYILFHMKDSEFYGKLVNSKGIENVEKRRHFLNLDEN